MTEFKRVIDHLEDQALRSERRFLMAPEVNVLELVFRHGVNFGAGDGVGVSVDVVTTLPEL